MGRKCKKWEKKKRYVRLELVPVPMPPVDNLELRMREWQLEYDLNTWMKEQFPSEELKLKFLEVRKRYPMITKSQWREKNIH